MERDQVVAGLSGRGEVRVVYARVTGVALEAQARHALAPGAALLMGQGLCGAALLVALQKEHSRLNLQLSGDGPVKGFLVDAGRDGALRGYVRNPEASVLGSDGPYRWRPLLGNSGTLSVLRELGPGEYYRSSVELSAFELAADLTSFLRQSDQTVGELALRTLSAPDQPVGLVDGFLLQLLPGAAEVSLEVTRGRLAKLWAERPGELEAERLVSELELTAVSKVPLVFRCECSQERVLRSLGLLAREELEDMLQRDGKAEVTCQMCGERRRVSADELRGLLVAST